MLERRAKLPEDGISFGARAPLIQSGKIRKWFEALAVLEMSPSSFVESHIGWGVRDCIAAMAGWISSKLKVAESLLQQIDQQAAESLGKSERKQSEGLNFENLAKSSGTVSLKDQLKKKAPENVDLIAKLGSDHSNYKARKSVTNDVCNSSNPEKEVSVSDSMPRSTLTDSDWTELLSTPKQSTPTKSKRGNGKSGIRVLRKDGGKVGNVGLNLKSRGGVVGSVGRAGDGADAKANGLLGDRRRSNGEECMYSDSSQRSSNVGSDDKAVEGCEFIQESAPVIKGDGEREVGFGRIMNQDALGNRKESDTEKKSVTPDSRSTDENPQEDNEAKVAAEDSMSNIRNKADGNDEGIRRNHAREGKPNVAVVSGDLKRGFLLGSDGASDSDSESGSTSDSEVEREREEKRKKRQQILAARAAAKATEAIKERENLVAKLEGEKQSLEKILEERAKQAAQEASELQSTMMEMMDAVDLEKQKHNNTRMEALSRLAKLETANADLARSLATAQWTLEVEVNRVAELRQQIELREVEHEELKRRIASAQQTGTSLDNSAASKGIKVEREMLVAEYSFVTDKIERLEEKARKLKENIDFTQKEMENPTEVEVELKRRLGQMTDHLIQKQLQVEALSSEKAMLLFRIEAVSKLLDENKPPASMIDFSGSSQDDLETGRWKLSSSKLKPIFEAKIQSGKQHLGSLLGQLDTVFSAGAVIWRRDPKAKLFSLIYLLCLHLWVLYILFSRSSSSQGARSVLSLDNINNTSGI
ncbi:hypothetical protein Nepgr_002917 [Nepenthes gracilis]|uniref:Golgin candidate 2 n=1 Tax=Nepenthes gracilis TaxID=150966 RepID=A0AAD3P7V9_NEPGR|nr:hypothetical protein Nepgr_002917 [Nepenthes gracilis]